MFMLVVPGGEATFVARVMLSTVRLHFGDVSTVSLAFQLNVIVLVVKFVLLPGALRRTLGGVRSTVRR